MKRIKVQYFTDIPDLFIHNEGDWVDLRAARTITMRAGEYKAIPLGVAMELPKGYEAIVAPRSSTFKRYGIMPANGIGVIDESYKGPDDQWHFLAYATQDTVIQKGDRICQFRIIKHQPAIGFRMVTRLKGRNRGGLGSTGRR